MTRYTQLNNLASLYDLTRGFLESNKRLANRLFLFQIGAITTIEQLNNVLLRLVKPPHATILDGTQLSIIFYKIKPWMIFKRRKISRAVTYIELRLGVPVNLKIIVSKTYELENDYGSLYEKI